MDTSRLNENRHSAKQSTQGADLCWNPLTVKFTGVFSEAVVIQPWPNFVNRFCRNCHDCLLFESTITGTKGQNGQYCSVKIDECKRERTFVRATISCLSLALFSWSTIGREIHVMCDVTLFPLFVVTVAGKIETICGRARTYYVPLHILQRIPWPFFQEAVTTHKVYS